MTRSHALALALGAIVALTACGSDKGSSSGAKDNSAKPLDSASSRTLASSPGAVGSDGANSVNANNAGAAPGTGPIGPVGAANAEPTGARGAPVDSATIAKTTGKLISGRNAHDQTAFTSAIRAGLRALASWPKAPVSPPGALLPAKRIVAYYGNPLSKRMGVLGEYPPDEMLRRLDETVAMWRKADPTTPVQPALHLIAVVAQGAPGKDGMYRLRMDTSLIEKVYGWAQSRHALLFLDIQVGQSTVQAELPRLMPFLARPDVHLALDPEFSMHYDKQGLQPGKKIGTMMAQDVNWAIDQLTKLVQEKKLPPKILVVHRFTSRMVPNAEQIRPNGIVQVVMDMDGWGPPWLKFDSYRDYIVAHPVEYTGFKIFYHNDVKKGDPLLTPGEVLQLRPAPLYIQYQ